MKKLVVGCWLLVVSVAMATGVARAESDSFAVRNVTSRQRYPWNGLVDIACDLTGVGLVKLNATVLKNGEAKLGVVIERSKSLCESAEWKPVSTNEVTVPAPGEQGFFIVAPQGE